MAEQPTVFGGVVQFLDRLGVYDVVLPFLLVFTIVFAILEKTRVLGIEKAGGEEFTKKNLNAIVAFVIAFLVVASTTLVRAINEVLANVVLLLVLVISFLMLVGVFFGTKEFTLTEHPGWTRFFMVLIFLAIVVIFLQALGWLTIAIGFILLTPDFEWVATVVLLVFIIAFMWYVTREQSHGHGGEHKSSEGKH